MLQLGVEEKLSNLVYGGDTALGLQLQSLWRIPTEMQESWLTAAIPKENPYGGARVLAYSCDPYGESLRRCVLALWRVPTEVCLDLQLQSLWRVPTEVCLGLQLQSLWRVPTEVCLGLQLQSLWRVPTAAVS